MINYRLRVSGPGWQRVTHCRWPPPFESWDQEWQAQTGAGKGVQAPGLVRGQGAYRKFPSSRLLSPGKTDGFRFRGGLPGIKKKKRGGQRGEISINWLQPSWNNLCGGQLSSLRPAHPPSADHSEINGLLLICMF